MLWNDLFYYFVFCFNYLMFLCYVLNLKNVENFLILGFIFYMGVRKCRIILRLCFVYWFSISYYEEFFFGEKMEKVLIFEVV